MASHFSGVNLRQQRLFAMQHCDERLSVAIRVVSPASYRRVVVVRRLFYRAES
jgi:hypothetical protein